MVLSRGWGVGGGEEINNKDHLSPAEAGRWAELGNMTMSTFYNQNPMFDGEKVQKRQGGAELCQAYPTE